ncbi:nuclear transport factor 2 family protein [Clostridium estertheticum]|uniref:nuclear transport factor 2 family protein n=1 Tax=Clostridium estertheticum TaxID=238834 RepID=UPI001C0AA56A|nr:nuclear transport factor 2 family protein [Clostridium estertheticum]WAG66587.1 nuclear transport factor 2 family protein [Clostridium estertheticum]
MNGEKAYGITYCQVTLRVEKDGKAFRTQKRLRYQNKYLKVSGEWKIKAMSSDIIWRETHEVIQEV